jgi:hypothetical protein
MPVSFLQLFDHRVNGFRMLNVFLLSIPGYLPF